MMKPITTCLTVLVIVSSASAAPTVLFDTFGPGDTYSPSTGYSIGSPTDYDEANQFMIGPTTPYSLDKIELAAGLIVGTNQLDVWLMSDTAGEPGAIIEAFNFVGAMGTFGSANPPLAANSVLHPILYPGTPYWLVASAPAADTWAAWVYALPSVYGTLAYRSDLGPWAVAPQEELGAFRITGTQVPAPGALLLGGIGAGLVGWLRRRRTL